MTTTHDSQNSDGKPAFSDADFLDWVAKLLHPEHAERVRRVARRMKGAQPTVAEHDRLRFQAAGLLRSTNPSDNRAGGALLTMLALHTPARRPDDRLSAAEKPVLAESTVDDELIQFVERQVEASRNMQQMIDWTSTEMAERILAGLKGALSVIPMDAEIDLWQRVDGSYAGLRELFCPAYLKAARRDPAYGLERLQLRKTKWQQLVEHVFSVVVAIADANPEYNAGVRAAADLARTTLLNAPKDMR